MSVVDNALVRTECSDSAVQFGLLRETIAGWLCRGRDDGLGNQFSAMTTRGDGGQKQMSWSLSQDNRLISQMQNTLAIDRCSTIET